MKTSKTKTETPAKELLAIAHGKSKSAKTWPELHNAVFGPGGPYGRLFPTLSQRTAFSKTSEHKAILKMMESLPAPAREADVDAYSGKLLVRLPKTIHAALAREAETENVSLNQLIVAKLSAQIREVVRL
ncbi:MAG: toxin-antitoxin system HicB family antitoxin [Planctomycetaceae bacterium]